MKVHYPHRGWIIFEVGMTITKDRTFPMKIKELYNRYCYDTFKLVHWATVVKHNGDVHDICLNELEVTGPQACIISERKCKYPVYQMLIRIGDDDWIGNVSF